ncbi:AMP-binding protein [Methanococcus maripaludis]|jgi:fatty-acyl-CoA synthase|uniref:AMP-binding protein n=3 Tax=Methanococcus maripaludis TaxID=39152 RepID=A0A8T3W9B3_METMI|nr:AMP-binding protein [Methanococcus maripaludis]AEK19608.1 AMP-binding domain protein [Methanococcus maripaludis X1]MBG0769790.1 AMP-binding protein [Methanococcus maripaludis]BAP60731.1 short-chain-fatty-acid--CoA ligase [Methanococcus maripaludis KA1]
MLFTNDTIGEFFEKQAQKDPDREFLVYPDRNLRFTYKEFDERTDLLAKGLLEIGIKKGDHIGIWARNVPDWLTFMFATAKIGVVLVTVNTAYKSHELAYVMKQSDMKALAIIDSFRDVNYLEILYELVPELKTSQRGKLNSEEFPYLKNVIYVGQEKHRGMYNTTELMLLGKYVSDEKLIEAKKGLDSNDVINMQYTSGTTGFPKGVMLTHKNILNNGYYIGEKQKFTEEERLCLPVPLFHCFGIVLGVLALLTHGGTLVMLEIFDPLLVLAAIQKEKCTAVYGVPTMFIAEFSHPMFEMFDLSSLRTGIMAGSTCPIEAMKKVMSDMYMREITISYGLTEASPVFTMTSVDDPFEKRVESVGKAMPHCEVKIIDPETGETLAPGNVGEICCRGYNVMKGYYKMPEKTAEVIEKDGWLHSGDLAVEDEDGYYKIVGRIKDMIIRGGENIYPREIEEFLYTMPGINDAQVVGIPDEKYGEIVGAFVIPKEGYEIKEEDVRDFALEKIARYKVPKHVFVVEEFPMTASGKIQKFKLTELAVELLKKKKEEL